MWYDGKLMLMISLSNDTHLTTLHEYEYTNIPIVYYNFPFRFKSVNINISIGKLNCCMSVMMFSIDPVRAELALTSVYFVRLC